jgi:hypothetical protein
VSTRLRLDADQVEWRAIEGEIVALDLRSSTYFAVNATGAVLWQPLLDGRTEDELTELLVATFGVDPRVAQDDVRAFVGMLTERRLLRA